MSLKELDCDYAVWIKGDFGDLKITSDREMGTIDVKFGNNYSLCVNEREFKGLTRRFVQFEEHVLNNNPVFLEQYANDTRSESMSYVEWLEHGYHTI